MKDSESKKNWTPTTESFGRFLLWLDEDVDSAGESYLQMRRRLVAYFDRKDCAAPDELADETLNRVVRRLSEEGAIETETPAKYCYTVARFVFMESLRAPSKKAVSFDDLPTGGANRFAASVDAEEKALEKEKMLECLNKCTDALDAENRELIVRYYHGEEQIKIRNRKLLAENLGISVNALTIRACRIRARLEICVKKCARKD